MTAPHHRLSCLAVQPHPRLPHRLRCQLAHEGLAHVQRDPTDRSESLEVNVYSRRRACGDGGALSDDIDSDDDDDESNSAPADDAHDDAYM